MNFGFCRQGPRSGQLCGAAVEAASGAADDNIVLHKKSEGRRPSGGGGMGSPRDLGPRVGNGFVSARIQQERAEA